MCGNLCVCACVCCRECWKVFWARRWREQCTVCWLDNRWRFSAAQARCWCLKDSYSTSAGEHLLTQPMSKVKHYPPPSCPPALLSQCKDTDVCITVVIPSSQKKKKEKNSPSLLPVSFKCNLSLHPPLPPHCTTLCPLAGGTVAPLGTTALKTN